MKKQRTPIQKVGLAPGSLVYTGKTYNRPVEINLISIQEQGVESRVLTIKDFPLVLPQSGHHWISVQGLNDVQIIEEIGKNFSIDMLILEDIVNVHQRPKFEDGPDYSYVVLKEPSFKQDNGGLAFNQTCLFIKSNVVLSFQEEYSEIFRKFTEQLKTPKSKGKRINSEKLFHHLLDCVVDHYFPAMAIVEARLYQIDSELEELLHKKSLYNKTRKKIFQQLFQIHEVRQDLHQLLHYTTPLIELILNLIQSEYFEEELRLYLNDIRDHILQINDNIKVLNDQTTSMLEITLSLNSFKLNDVMRTLTLFTAFFMPLTFLTSVYGMNFKQMPFLDHPYGFALIVTVMLLILIGLIIFVRRKNWIA
ncbi:MAG: magnesium/cobalt transporter CorA [Bdellovibrio sp.]|nr:magnesium/cobalt transporter CorA [Bdellovibrio sp.]